MAITDHDMRAIIRAQQLDDMLTAIRAWKAATGTERTYRRRYAASCIAEFREFHMLPERRAFNVAVAREAERRRAGLTVPVLAKVAA